VVEPAHRRGRGHGMNLNDSIVVILMRPPFSMAPADLRRGRRAARRDVREFSTSVSKGDADGSGQRVLGRAAHCGPDWLVLLLATLLGGAAAMATSLFTPSAVGLRANQIVSGLAITIFAGRRSRIGMWRESREPARTKFTAGECAEAWVMCGRGPRSLFHQNVLVYASWDSVILKPETI